MLLKDRNTVVNLEMKQKKEKLIDMFIVLNIYFNFFLFDELFIIISSQKFLETTELYERKIYNFF
jgi:hypothetical protein